MKQVQFHHLFHVQNYFLWDGYHERVCVGRVGKATGK